NGDSNANVLNGGEGSDLLQGGGGKDTFIGGNGPGVGTVTFLGAQKGVTAGPSTVTGTAGDGGPVTLTEIENPVGSRVKDKLVGDSGDNVFTGGKGADTLTGKGGADTFVYTSTADSTVSGATDTITDFNAKVDKIDLAAIADSLGVTFQYVSPDFAGAAGTISA